MNNKTFDILSLFSGGGFLDIGFINNGFQVVEAVEIQPYFIKAYNGGLKSYFKDSDNYYVRQSLVSHTEIVQQTDASCPKEQERLQKSYTDLSGIIGGPPCQDYSVGGKNGGIEGERGRLIYSYFTIIKNNKPDFLFFENVKGLYNTKKHRISFDAFVKDIESEGYYVWHDLLNVLEYGYPQDRPRIALVAFKKTICHVLQAGGYTLEFDNNILKFEHSDDLLFRWPEPLFKNPKNLNWPAKWKFGNDVTEFNATHVPQLCAESVLGDLTDQDPNQCEFFVPKSARFTQVEEGDTNRKSFKRLHRFRYSPTVAYGNNEVHLHPTKARRLSVREGLRLQTVPDEYVLPTNIPLTHKFKLISNGVPTAKAELIAKEIRRTLINYHSCMEK
ncbi:MAG: DNA cytosine methyltransferase [Flavobacteriia bacterium]|nr:DNA cytosine methyltransferase [Flavobacteriia bacterium]